MADKLIGAAIRRREDPALVVGAGRFVDDLSLPGLLHLALARSPHPRARVLGIETKAAEVAPGVVAVVTGRDVASLGSLP
ncbi:MAG: xanthine dehydrogenase family protein molybdopterin-binding subunit, partial [Chloroflexi bacterium]|nr:xanthine dehydrogenase family protein molybdopterin-binding subunit [Chloroflexota bacterium]